MRQERLSLSVQLCCFSRHHRVFYIFQYGTGSRGRRVFRGIYPRKPEHARLSCGERFRPVRRHLFLLYFRGQVFPRHDEKHRAHILPVGGFPDYQLLFRRIFQRLRQAGGAYRAACPHAFGQKRRDPSQHRVRAHDVLHRSLFELYAGRGVRNGGILFPRLLLLRGHDRHFCGK